MPRPSFDDPTAIIEKSRRELCMIEFLDWQGSRRVVSSGVRPDAPLVMEREHAEEKAKELKRIGVDCWVRDYGRKERQLFAKHLASHKGITNAVGWN